jgi:hypothetical protein
MASTTCPNCQTVTPAGTAFCPSCGNALSGAPSMSQTAATPPPAAASPRPQSKVDLSGIGQLDRIVGGGSLVLFISLFLPWFSASGISVDALDPHGYLYVTLVLSIAVVAFIGAEILGVWKLPASTAVSRDQILLIATAINFVLVLIGFIFKPSGEGVVNVGWSWGAFVGLIAAVVAVFPLGWPLIQARLNK